MSIDLFSKLTKQFSVTRLTAHDAECKSDSWHDLRNLVMDCEAMYPRIERWMDDQVRGGLITGARSAFVAYHQGRPVVSSVVKHGPTAKFCHLRVTEALQGSNLGEFFFVLMAMAARPGALRVHFTLPESLWAEKRAFFSSFSFSRVEKSGRQYRLFDEELHCSAAFPEVWHAVIRKLPKLRAALEIGGASQDSDLVLSMKPRFANAVLAGRKRIELRKSFSRRWAGRRFCIYASSPSRSLVGEAVIEQILEASPGEIWSQFATDLGCSKQEFDAYASGTSKIYALVLAEVTSYQNPVPLQLACDMLGEPLRPPQSYQRIKDDSPWSRAVPIASILQTRGGVAAI